MNTLKGWISPLVLIAVFATASMSANAGIIVGTLSNEKSCDQTVKVDWGIIVGTLTGIIVGQFTGIIVGTAVDTPPQPCKA